MKDKNLSPILDNRQTSLAQYLREHLKDAEQFRIVSAYFSVFGFGALADKLESASLNEVRFLFGEPESASEVIAGETSVRTFDLTETGLSLDESGLGQRDLAKRCIEWMRQDSVKVRKIAKSNFLHGKMYHLESKDSGVATVGSSNFTLRGMGESQNPNIEINLAVKDEQTLDGLASWFDKLWGDTNLTTDAKEEALAALARWHEEYSPEFIYYKTLFELFRDKIDARMQEEADEVSTSTKLNESQIWNILYGFQRDGATSVINRLIMHNGCILADSVGLGKTYTALAVVKYFELRNKQVLVLCPKKLEQNWRIYQASAQHQHNPFKEDKFGYTLLAHTDLTRERGKSGIIDLEKFNWGAYDLVVIDESHNFRNESKSRRNEEGQIIRLSRYEKLMDEVIKNGAQTKVLMLSATPVNISLHDLQNQIYLITGKNDAPFAKSIGIDSIKRVIDAAQKEFKIWEATGDTRHKDQLLEALGNDFMKLLSELTIARSRTQIRKFYSEFIEEKGDFPQREKPQNEYPHADLREELSYEELNEDLSKLSFHIYCPSAYVTDTSTLKELDAEKEKLNFNQIDREESLVGMMRINFLKRLESSAHACKLTLTRTIAKIDTQIGKIDRFIKMKENSQTEMPDQTEDTEEDEDFAINSKMLTYHLHDLNVERWRKDMLEDHNALKEALNKIKKIEPERDGKLTRLKEQIRERFYNSAKPNSRKLLVFTAFRDTAEYLYEHVKPLAKELNINIALVAGDLARAECCAKNFSDILNHFAPKACGHDYIEPNKQVNLLIATDCISEGQNLQDCDTVLNYDIHWNPVRLIQRFGRIDRLGTEHKSIYMINYWPTEDMDVYLNLERRVRARMVLANIAATGDDDSLDTTEMEQTMKKAMGFRDQELLKIRDELTDLHERQDTISLSDFTMDYFITQLLRYLQKQRKQLTEAPPGIYAVTDTAHGKIKDPQPQDGAIFFFKHCNPDGETLKNVSHPFYFVHVERNKVRHGCIEIRTILNNFEAFTIGKKKPLLKLCDSFSAEMKTKEGAKIYDKFAQLAIGDIDRISKEYYARMWRRDTARGDILLENSDQPSTKNLRLLTWLVIKNNDVAEE